MEEQIKYSPEGGFAEAQARILQWKENSNVDNALELYSLNLNSIPDEIKELQGIQELDLSDNNLYSLDNIVELTSLISLNVSDNHLKDGKSLGYLLNLEGLNACGNQLTSIEWVKSLKQLSSFQVAGNQLISIKGISGLDKLEELDVCSNQLPTLSGLSDLKALECLYINHNKLSSFDGMEQLLRVDQIHMQDNHFRNLSGIEKLPSLKFIDAARNKITNLVGLLKMKNLQYLDLSANQLLDLSGEYPNTDLFESLVSLETLNISSNPVLSLRQVKPLLEKGLRLVLTWDNFKYGTIVAANCTFYDPPTSIAEQGTKAVLSYWSQLDFEGLFSANYSSNFSGRILLVGEGEAGKTSLKKKLLDPETLIPPTSGREPQTPAIDTEGAYTFQADYQGETREFSAALWDFGGQVEKYMTHQFFFGRHSLYVLLVNARSQSPNFEYWIRIISLLGSRRDQEPTTIIIVVNEQASGSIYRPSVRQYQEDFPHLNLIVECVNLSKTADKENDPRYYHLLSTIEREFALLPRIGEIILDSYFKVKNRLSTLKKEGHNYITFEEFTQVCQDDGLQGFDEIDIFVRHLHAIGEVIHYADLYENENEHSSLSRYVFLNPEWVINALYKVLEFPGNDERNGRVPRQLLRKVWVDYEHEEQQFLEELLSEDAFEICYPMEGNKYLLIPSLLPLETPDFDFGPKEQHGLRFRFNYPILMPQGLISRLLVRLHEMIEGQHYYRYGAIFTDNGIRARVERLKTGENNKNVIDIWVDQIGPDARYFLRRIREEVKKIHRKSFPQIKVEELVPCRCFECLKRDDPYYHSLEILLRRERKRPNAKTPCNISDEDVYIKEILEGVFSEVEIESPPFQLPKGHQIVSDKLTDKLIEKAGNTFVNPKIGDNANFGNTNSGSINTGDNATVNTYAGAAASTTPEPTSWWRYVLEPQHIRGLLLALVLGGIAGGIITWFFGLIYGTLVAAVVFGVMCYVGLNREAGYLRLVKSVIFTGFGSVTAMNVLPKIVGFLKLKYESENGNIGFSGNLVNDPPLWISITILAATAIIVLGILYLNKEKPPKA